MSSYLGEPEIYFFFARTQPHLFFLRLRVCRARVGCFGFLLSTFVCMCVSISMWPLFGYCLTHMMDNMSPHYQ